MNTTHRVQIDGLGSVSPTALSPNPAVALVEGAHLAGVVSILMGQAWLQAMAESMTLSHNLTLASLGVHPAEHAAPWDDLATSTGTGLFEAMDKVLAALGD